MSAYREHRSAEPTAESRLREEARRYAEEVAPDFRYVSIVIPRMDPQAPPLIVMVRPEDGVPVSPN